jgi:hypothetical protein
MVLFFINVPLNSKVGVENEKRGTVYDPQATNRGTDKWTAVAKKANISQIGGDITGGPIKIAPGMKQLKSAIALYMPQNWQERYSANYSEIKTGGIGGLLADTINSNGQTLAKVGDFAGGLTRLAVQGAISNVIDAALGEGAGGKLTGQIRNPNAEQAFNGMEFRSFDFDFTMTPKSKEEADSVLNIINTFKYFMHPEISTDDSQYLVFPAEFEIEFYSNGNVNQFIGSLSTCALTNVSVNYTPNNIWSAFKDTGGYPSSVQLHLNFVEVEPLTKNKLDSWRETPKGVPVVGDSKVPPRVEASPQAGGPIDDYDDHDRLFESDYN